MNFLELINRTLVELNYKEVSSWDGLTLNDHKRLKEIIKRLNAQICAAEEWPFLQRKCAIKLFGNETKIENPVFGSLDIICIDGVEYHYSPDYKAFLTGNQIAGHFAIYAEHILIPKQHKPCICEILYNSDNSAIDENQEEKHFLENETDESLLHEAFQEPILIYGACMRLKGNTEHSKFKYWYSMFNEAMATLRAKCMPSKKQFPKVTLFRE